MVSKELLREVLLEQRRRVKQARTEGFVRREKLDEVKRFIKVKQCIIISGVRRCGKSVFLSQIINSFFNDYYYANFEDERLADFGLEDFNKLYEVCIELFGESKTFFLDEVQNVAGWEKWVRRMYDDGFKFFITGSNARLLSKELATSLTGRHLQFSVFPFSFREFLDFHNFGFKVEDVYLTERRALIVKYFSQYLNEGGFPEYLKYGKVEILQGYFNDIIQRDIVARYNVGSVKELKELVRYIITNTGNLATYNQLRRLTEVKSVSTVIKYFSYLENAYLLFSVPYFSYSLRKQVANPFKVFAVDAGLRNAVSFRFSKDLGRIYETVVAIELKRKGREVYYWRNPQHEEVDFVVKDGKVEQLIQVCYELEEFDVEKREIRALVKAGKDLACNNLLVITGDYEGEEKANGKKVKFVPLWKWLLV